jgi:SAM-dependent methyltransferase
MLRRGTQALRLRAADIADAALGRRGPLVPPRRLRDFVGDSDFATTGEEFLGHFHSLADLRPSDRVLDVGCGIGRMARVLAGELRAPGSYDGFDIVGEAIEWCASRYTGLPASFCFVHADLMNARYNPTGHGSAADFEFPYPAASFDLVIATSVFTHLVADAADNYLGQIARVLAPGGRLFSSWLMFDDGGAPVDAAFAFRADGPVAFADQAVPEAAVGYRESWVRQRCSAHGLRIREPVRYGSWRGSAGLSFHDLLVADVRHEPGV